MPPAKRILLAYRHFSSSYTAYPWMLSEGGLTVDALTTRKHPVRHSRYLNRHIPFDGDADFIEALRRALTTGKYDCLLCIDEPARDLLFAHRSDPEFQPYLPFAEDSELFEAVKDKSRFYSWCAQHDIPTPQTTEVTTYEAAHEEASKMGYPIVLKAPAGSGGTGVFLIQNAEELRAQIESGEIGSLWLIQEFISGPVGSTTFAARHGEVFAHCSSEKYLSLGDGLGPSAVRRFNPDPQLGEIAQQIATAGGITGITGFDWMEISVGHFVVIDPHLGRGTTTAVLSPLAGVSIGKGMASALNGGSAEPAQNNSNKIVWTMPQSIELTFQGQLFNALRKANPLRKDVSIFWSAPGEWKLLCVLYAEYLLGQTRIRLGRILKK
jgi:predicted ATP-grasp superfamily ATP-dependent carboligase